LSGVAKTCDLMIGSINERFGNQRHRLAPLPAYNEATACRNRKKNFDGLRQSDYPAAILKTGTGFFGGALGGIKCS
jgi:hypothetical protein